MRICVLYKRDNLKKNSFSIHYLGSFMGAEIYKTEISEKLSKRRLPKLVKRLSELKISFVAADAGLHISPILIRFGITPASGERMLSGHCADAALCLANFFSLPFSFFISGGSFRSVTRTALRLLEETGDVFISCTDFDAVAEACFDSCGAVVKRVPNKEHITILLYEDGFEISFSDKKFSHNIFSLSLPGFPFDIPERCHTALSEALCLCGVPFDFETKIVIS